MFIRKHHNSLLSLFLSATLLLWVACDTNNVEGNNSDAGNNEKTENGGTENTPVFDDDYSGKQYGLPSPFQVASLVKQSGFNYMPELLNPKNKYKDYLNNFSKSLNLGIYGTDLGYAAIFEKTQDAIDYLNTCKIMADDLGIIGAFENRTIKRIERNINNQDSLLFIVARTFSKSDEYLKQNERNITSALILAGGWIEALYLATECVNKKMEEEVINRIGEQKISLNILLLLLNQFKEDDPEIEKLIGSLDELREIYRNVEIKYIYREPNPNPDQKFTEVMTTSQVEINEEVLAQITSKIGSIRNTITN